MLFFPSPALIRYVTFLKVAQLVHVEIPNLFFLLLDYDPTPEHTISCDRQNGFCITRIYLKKVAVLWGGTLQVEAGQNSYVSLWKIYAMK